MGCTTFDAICNVGKYVALVAPGLDPSWIKAIERHIIFFYKDRRKAISSGSLAHRRFALWP